jgi:ribulose-5-phosphate 4-epimerase/fuculose-1-phosphate aldolase
MNVDEIIAKLVDANHILAREGVVDAFGHISVRHPEKHDRFFLSCSRSPELVGMRDIMEFTLDGAPTNAAGRSPYLERFIHGAIYEMRPEVQSVVHNHAYAVIPFGASKTKLRPIFHSAGRIGKVVPVWDIRRKFGSTNMLVNDLDKGRDLAVKLGGNSVVLMRGHGCTVVGISIEDAVLSSIYLQVNAQLQTHAMQLGPVSYLSDGEIDIITSENGPDAPGQSRAWEYLLSRARKT